MTNFNRKIKKYLTCYLLVAVCSVSFVANAGPFSDLVEKRMERRKEIKEEIKEDILKKLNLTSEQKSLLKKQREEYKTRVTKTRNELWLNIKKLRLGLENKDVEDESVYTIADKVKVLRDKLFYERINTILSIKNVLTTEQYKKLQEFKNESFASIAERIKARREKGGKLREFMNK